DLTPDGSALMMTVIAPPRGIRAIERMSAEGGELTTVVAPGVAALGATVSPDGRWLAYAAGDSGRLEVYVQSLSGSSRSQVSIAGGLEPHWAPHGHALYYQKEDEMVMVPVELTSTFVAGKPKTLFAGVVPLLVDSAETYHIAPRGDRFIM